NDDVRSKGLIKPKTFVHDRHRLLTVRSQASLFQLVSHYYFVNRFEKTWTKFRMNTKSGVQYLLRDFVFCHAFAPLCPLWTLCEIIYARSRNRALFGDRTSSVPGPASDHWRH